MNSSLTGHWFGNTEDILGDGHWCRASPNPITAPMSEDPVCSCLHVKLYLLFNVNIHLQLLTKPSAAAMNNKLIEMSEGCFVHFARVIILKL